MSIPKFLLACVFFTLAFACESKSPNERLVEAIAKIEDSFMEDRQKQIIDNAVALVRQGANPNAVFLHSYSSQQYTLLVSALTYGTVAQVTELLELGADPNQAAEGLDVYGPPLCQVYSIYASGLESDDVGMYERAEALVKLLLDSGADINGCPLMGILARYGQNAFIQELFGWGAKLDRVSISDTHSYAQDTAYIGDTLYAAALGGHNDTMDLLLAAGAVLEEKGELLIASVHSHDLSTFRKSAAMQTPENVEELHSQILMRMPDRSSRYQSEVIKRSILIAMLRVLSEHELGVTVKAIEALPPEHNVPMDLLDEIDRG